MYDIISKRTKITKRSDERLEDDETVREEINSKKSIVNTDSTVYCKTIYNGELP